MLVIKRIEGTTASLIGFKKRHKDRKGLKTKRLICNLQQVLFPLSRVLQFGQKKHCSLVSVPLVGKSQRLPQSTLHHVDFSAPV